MKNYDPIHVIGHTDIPASPHFPKGHGVVDTVRLWGLLPLFMAELCSFFSRESVRPGAAKRIGEMRRMVRTLYRMERQNFCSALINALRQNPIWQAQVRGDLGGYQALNRWDRRHALLTDLRDGQQRKRPARSSLSRRHKATTKITTDRYGLFRLAPMTSGRKRVARPDTRSARIRTRLVFSFPWPKPVPVTPHDLRHSLGQTGLSCNKGQADPTPMRELVSVWQGLYECFLRWSHALMTADLALTLPAFRDDMIPP